MKKKSFTLDKDFGEQWIAALRSGKYEQSQIRLKRKSLSTPNSYSYCSLGVAAELLEVPLVAFYIQYCIHIT